MASIFSAAVGAAAAAGAVYALKKKGFCPACAVKKAARAFGVHPSDGENFSNGTALTPPMGWSSWNLFRNNINEDLICEVAKALKDSGLAGCGYSYVNLDDCWQSSVRDRDGRLQGDLTRFSHGIPALVEKINALGLKAGIYTSNGTLTCEDLPSSLGHEAVDADTFASWGIEYFKYDFCHNRHIPMAGPELDKLYIGRSGHEDDLIIEAETGETRGTACVKEDPKLATGKYVTGLGCGSGSIVFYDVEVPEAGEYTLTLGIRKSGWYKKYAEITVNGDKVYPVTVPETTGFTHEGRIQTTVVFEAGKNSILITNPIASPMDSAAKQYTNMGLELKRATAEYAAASGRPEKPICYSICEWGFNRPWKWGMKAGNLWRTTMDIMPTWDAMLRNYEINVRLFAAAGPGNWNDPDMLEVGNGNFTQDENRAHFSLWCMMASPLILGNDPRTFLNENGSVRTDDPVYGILTNREMIAIDQDELGQQCRRVKTNGLNDILVKKLSGNRAAICFFNKGPRQAEMSCELADIFAQPFLSMPVSPEYRLRDVWAGKDFETDGHVTAQLSPHSVRVLVCANK